MCTLTWILYPEGYEVFMNRDERIDRPPAEAPREREARGVKYLAPRDPEGGGTWIAANEYGLTLALANLYPVTIPETFRAPKSRGLLVADLASSASTAEAEDRLAATDLFVYRPFLLCLFAPGAEVRIARWDGRSLDARAPAPYESLLATSAVDPEGVASARREFFERMQRETGLIDSDLLERFHRSHDSAPSARSVCMHREKARTVSLSRIRVGPASVEFWYAPGPPCEAAFAPPLRLGRGDTGGN